MSLTTLTLAAALTATPAPCNWNKPGANPYRGPVRESVASALKRYQDIPAHAAADIISKVRLLQPDTTMTITRDGLWSMDGQVSNLRDMHYGKATMCSGPVQRSAWSDSHAETAMVYCSGPHCVAIPIICGNVSRVDYVPAPARPADEPMSRGFPGLPNSPSIAPKRPVPSPVARPVFTVPEPGTAAMLITGLIVMAAVRRFK